MSTSRLVRSRRPAKRPADPLTPLRQSWEEERTAGGAVPVLTVILAGAECPFSCVFCDLWRDTLDGPTPEGAIPHQIEKALGDAGPLPDGAGLKLYNASSFFDPRAVPPCDDATIAELLRPFSRVTVECHPRFIGERCVEFSSRLPGTLEVAIGLETADPAVLDRLNKGMTLETFNTAAAHLRAAGIDLRAFCLLSPPFTSASDIVPGAVSSAAYAVERGAAHVSLIPTRDGNGVMGDLQQAGDWQPPTLRQLEQALEDCLALDSIVTADLWDADRLATCECTGERVARIAEMNASGRAGPPVACTRCEAVCAKPTQ